MTVYRDITELIGDTPLLHLDPAVHGLDNVELYAKLESHNPMGSVKDRIAWAMLRGPLDDIAAREQTLIEASSGNTAKALQVLARTRGIPVRAVTNRVKVGEVRDMLQLLGTDIVELPGLSECPDPTAPNDVFSVIEQTMAGAPGVFHHLSQYTNDKNVAAHYDGTGAEIQADLGRVDYLVGGLGTTGSTRGTATALRQHNPQLRAIGVVSDRSDFIPGIRSAAEMWDVGLFQPDFYDEIVTVDADRAINATLELASGYGVLAGPTSGASYAAALRILARAEPAAEPIVAVMLVCDRLEPYLSYIKKRQPERFSAARQATPHPDDIAAAQQLSPDELAELIGQPHVLVVDTRGAFAYRIGHIPGSINIRDDQLDDMLTSGVPFSRSQEIVFVCPAGEASRRYAARVRYAGYESASLAGGITAWRDNGQPLESAATTPDNASR